MHQDFALIATVAISFVFAAVLGYLADRLRLPPLVGYLIAGVLIGPFTSGVLADASLAGQLAEMGVVLLMFGVGLHFSTADLLAVRGVAVPGAIGQVVVVTALCGGLMWIGGWPVGAGIVYGLSLAVASTVVLLKALEDRNLIDTPKGRVAVGWLIAEDLVTVLALVLLPLFAQAASGNAGGEAVAAAGGHPIAVMIVLTLLKVAAFGAIAILLGPKIVPWLLIKVARTGSPELFTLTVLAIALGIAFGSTEIFGVSFALGAFFAGVILGESDLSHRAAADSLPLQNAFSVLFFVSVGMLFNPAVLVDHPAEVAGALALIILAKFAVSLAIVLLLRYPLSMGLTIAAGRTQIGEFSFILAGLGVSVGLLPREGQDVILAAALVSITVNPLVFAAVEKLEELAASIWPSFSSRYGSARQDVLRQELERIHAIAEERSREHQLKIQQLIETFPLLSEVDRHAQEQLLLLFRPKSASPGTRVLRVGDWGDGMYFIASGAVEVILEDEPIRLEAGAFFGEMALLNGGRRTADIIAVDFCHFLVLERRDFNMFMSRHPMLRMAVSDTARVRAEMNISRKRRGQSLEAN
jgi:CPA2 family monovalent cation:H+ antiporter-2